MVVAIPPDTDSLADGEGVSRIDSLYRDWNNTGSLSVVWLSGGSICRVFAYFRE